MSKIRWFRGFGWVGTGAALGAVLGVGCGAEHGGDAEPPVASASEAVTTTNGIVVTGGVHACAIVQGGAVKCWGNNSDGELGLGDTVNRGTVSTQMGDSLPSVYLALAVRRKLWRSAAITPAPCSTTTRSSAGARTAPASSVETTPPPSVARRATCKTCNR